MTNLKNDQKVMRVKDLRESTTTTSFGNVRSTITIPTAGIYKIWVRMNVPDTTNNAVNLQVNTGNTVKVGDGEINPNTWTWVDFKNGNMTDKLSYSLAAGENTITLTGIEKDVKVDRIIVTDETCIPTDKGDNCTNPTVPNNPPTGSLSVTITSPANGSTVSNVVAVNAEPATNIEEISFRVNGVWQATDSEAPFSWNWDTKNTSNGSNTITIRARKVGDPGNIYTEKSNTVTVQNSITTAPEPPPADTQAPTKPSSLFASLRVDAFKLRYVMDLRWNASVDNFGIREYKITRNDRTIGVTSTTKFTDNNGLQNNQLYTYKVNALDTAGNVSEPASLTVITRCVFIFCSLGIRQ